MIRIKVKGPNGLSQIVESDSTSAETLEQFRTRVCQSNRLSTTNYDILIGYPPRLCTADCNDLIRDAFKNGDTVILQLRPPNTDVLSVVEIPTVPSPEVLLRNPAIIERRPLKRTLPDYPHYQNEEGYDQLDFQLSAESPLSSSSSLSNFTIVEDETSNQSYGAWDVHEASPSPVVASAPPKPKWEYVRPFESMEAFNLWKSTDDFRWLIGTHSNNGQWSYKNFKCNSHVDCNAQLKIKFEGNTDDVWGLYQNEHEHSAEEIFRSSFGIAEQLKREVTEALELGHKAKHVRSYLGSKYGQTSKVIPTLLQIRTFKANLHKAKESKMGMKYLSDLQDFIREHTVSCKREYWAKGKVMMMSTCVFIKNHPS